MIIKKIVAAKGKGRKRLVDVNNIMAFIFIIIVLCYALASGLKFFAWFCLGLVVGRIFEIIFEIKEGLFDKPFLHYLILIAIPIQWLWCHYSKY